MNKLFLLAVTCLLSATCVAQSLNVKQGQVTYNYNSTDLDEVSFNGTDITIASKTFSANELSSIYVDNTEVADNTVDVSYNGNTATVLIAGNLANIVEAKVSGAHVTLLQNTNATDEITYTLSGTSTNGSLYMDGKLKATFVLNGVNLCNPDSAAINIQCGKRIAITLAEGTTNSLSDGLSSTDDGTDAHKAALYVQGHTEFAGAGSLTVAGYVKHAIVSHEYLLLKKSVGTITVTIAQNDGLHVGGYYEQRGGTVNVTALGDGLDVSEDSDTTTENNGEIIISGGTLTITTTVSCTDAAKCDSNYTQTDGTVKLYANGAGGRALNIDGSATIAGGYAEGYATGAIYDSGGDNERKPHALSADGSIYIQGGEAYFGSINNKSFKADSLLKIDGGKMIGIGGKSVSAASVSTQSSNTYTKQTINAGSTITYDGVSCTVPTNFSISKANVIVSGN